MQKKDQQLQSKAENTVPSSTSQKQTRLGMNLTAINLYKTKSWQK